MKKSITLILGIILITALSGCTSGEETGQAVTNVLNEAGEAYGNVATKINTTKEWVNTKVEQVDQTKKSIDQATDSIGTAVDSFKELSDLSGPDATK